MNQAGRMKAGGKPPVLLLCVLALDVGSERKS
jgi:hypothetical protein